MKRLIYGSFFLICMALIGYSKHTYIQNQHEKAQSVFGLLQSQIQGEPMDSRNQLKMKEALSKYPDSVYLLLHDPATQAGWGFINAVSFDHGAHIIEQKLHDEGTVPTFDWMTRMGAKSEFIQTAVFQWPKQTWNIHYGYLSPAHRFDWYKREQAILVGFYLWLMLGSLLSFFYFFSPAQVWQNTRKPKAAEIDTSLEDEIIEQVETKATEQAYAETQADDEMDDQVQLSQEQEEQDDPIVAILDGNEEDDTAVDDIPKQIWLRLLDQANTNEWHTKGNLYVRETQKGIHAVLFPWGTSMVTQREMLFSTYLFEAEARVMSGQEGFVVLFQVNNHDLIWVLGGWKNTRCEVVGYDSTKTTHTIEPRKWHHVRVEKDHEEVIGYMDGRTAWRLSLSDITKSSEDLGFLKGLGVGVWSTSTKFRNIRILKI
jgi:hypothetical protein